MLSKRHLSLLLLIALLLAIAVAPNSSDGGESSDSISERMLPRSEHEVNAVVPFFVIPMICGIQLHWLLMGLIVVAGVVLAIVYVLIVQLGKLH